MVVSYVKEIAEFQFLGRNSGRSDFDAFEV